MMPPNSTPDLAELDRLYAAAAQGEWSTEHRETKHLETTNATLCDGNGRVIADTLNADDVMIFNEPDEDCAYWVEGYRIKDLEFCAALHNAYPALAARIRELEAHVERLVKAANGLPCWTPELSKVIGYDPLYGPSPKWYPSTVLVNAEPLVEMREALATTPAASLAAIKAEALREFAAKVREDDALMAAYHATCMEAEATRLEGEARDDHN